MFDHTVQVLLISGPPASDPNLLEPWQNRAITDAERRVAASTLQIDPADVTNAHVTKLRDDRRAQRARDRELITCVYCTEILPRAQMIPSAWIPDDQCYPGVQFMCASTEECLAAIHRVFHPAASSADCKYCQNV
jgi:hypothetical protein